MLNYQANECRLFIITNRTSFELYFKKKIFNNGTLLKGVLITKLLNIPIACCSLINLKFFITAICTI